MVTILARSGYQISSKLHVTETNAHILIERQIFTVPDDYAIRVPGPQKSVTIRNCIFEGCKTRPAIFVGDDHETLQSTTKNVHIQDCVFLDHVDVGGATLLVTAENVVIDGCQLQNCSGDGIFTKALRAVISNNTIEGQDPIQAAIVVKGQYRGEPNSVAAFGYGAIVTNNNIFDCTLRGIFSACGESVVSNNVIEKCVWFGIDIRELVGRHVCSGNKVTNVTDNRAGIAMWGAHESVCNDNVILDLTGDYDHGIRWQNNDPGTMHGVCSGNLTSGIIFEQGNWDITSTGNKENVPITP